MEIDVLDSVLIQLKESNFRASYCMFINSNLLQFIKNKSLIKTYMSQVDHYHQKITTLTDEIRTSILKSRDKIEVEELTLIFNELFNLSNDLGKKQSEKLNKPLTDGTNRYHK